MAAIIAPMHASYEEYQVRSICRLNQNTVSIVVDPPGPLAKWRPSCFARIYTDDTGVYRAYTPISLNASSELIFAVKLYKGGMLSEHIRKKRVGDNLKIEFPIEKRTYVENEFRNILMVAGGTGVTPMMQILEHRHHSTTDVTMFTLLFCNRTKEEVFLKAYLDRYHAFCNVVCLFDSTSFDSDKSCWKTKYAISTNVLKEYTEDGGRRSVDFIYVSGPCGMLEAVCGAKEAGGQGELRGILKSLGFSADCVYKF